MPQRHGLLTPARIAIPLVAALAVAIVLPALLLRERGPGVLPVAAPVASASRIVHTQTAPRTAPKRHAGRRIAPVAAKRSATGPRAGHASAKAPRKLAPARHARHAKPAKHKATAHRSRTKKTHKAKHAKHHRRRTS